MLRFIERTFPSAAVHRRKGNDFGELVMNGRTFIITEPWGDNSRYTIHQRPVEPSPELDAIRDAFARYRPSPLFSGGRSFTLFLLSAAALILLIAVAVGWLSS